MEKTCTQKLKTNIKEKKINLTIQLPDSLHRIVKSMAALSGMSMKDYLIYLIDKEKNLHAPQ